MLKKMIPEDQTDFLRWGNSCLPRFAHCFCTQWFTYKKDISFVYTHLGNISDLKYFN